MLMQQDERELPEWLQILANDPDESAERAAILRRRAEHQRASKRYARLELTAIVALGIAVCALAAWIMGAPAI
jgi:DNA-binding transcriptional ArsR family regulator